MPRAAAIAETVRSSEEAMSLAVAGEASCSGRSVSVTTRGEGALAQREEAAKVHGPPELLRGAGEPVERAAAALGRARPLKYVKYGARGAYGVDREDLWRCAVAHVRTCRADPLERGELRIPRLEVPWRGVESYLTYEVQARNSIEKLIAVGGALNPPGMEPCCEHDVLLVSQRRPDGEKLTGHNRDAEHPEPHLCRLARHGDGVGEPPDVTMCVP